MIAKTAAERKADERARMRAAGFVHRLVYVHDKDWLRVQTYIERVRKAREKKRAEPNAQGERRP